MEYFTADLHLGHANIISFCGRPFATVEEMDRTLIDNWNSRVTDRDDVYILGDLFYRKREGIEETLRQLKGRKHLIVGNHDHTWIRRVDTDRYFMSVNDLLMLKTEGRQLVLCHYPMLSWPSSFHGSYCVYGHIHNSTQVYDGWAYIKARDHMLNAGVDVNGFYPVTFDEMVRNNEAFKEEH